MDLTGILDPILDILQGIVNAILGPINAVLGIFGVDPLAFDLSSLLEGLLGGGTEE